MKRSLLTLVTVVLALPALAQQARLTPNDSLPEFNLRVLRQTKVQSGGRTITINRVAPPTLLERPAPLPAPAPLTAEERETLRRREGKKTEMVFLTATVYDHEVTALRWFSEGREYHAFSNLDFNYFRGLGEIETEDTIYTLLFAIGDETREVEKGAGKIAGKVPPPDAIVTKVPTLAEFSKERSEYLIVEDQGKSDPSGILSGLDALHVHFDAHRREVVEGFARREQQRLANEQWQAEHPPAPKKDAIVTYWFGKDAVVTDAPDRGRNP